jgi:hypothetical protein
MTVAYPAARRGCTGRFLEGNIHVAVKNTVATMFTEPGIDISAHLDSNPDIPKRETPSTIYVRHLR